MKKVQASFLTMVIPYDETTDQLLLINRPKERGYPGYIGAGGKVELNESFSEAAVRELKEETGLIAKTENLIFKGTDEYVVQEDSYRYIVFNYLIKVWSGSLLSHPPEGELQWVKRENIGELPMQDWFTRRLPYFFQDATFEICSISQTSNDGEVVRKERSVGIETGIEPIYSKGKA